MSRLQKVFYELKQVPKAWYGMIVKFFNHCGYLITLSNAIFFIKANRDKLAIVLVYIDDLIIIGDCEEKFFEKRRIYHFF